MHEFNDWMNKMTQDIENQNHKLRFLNKRIKDQREKIEEQQNAILKALYEPVENNKKKDD